MKTLNFQKPFKNIALYYFLMNEIYHIIDEIVDNVVSEYKDCSKCGISKLKNCFGKDKRTKDGLYYCCKDCRKGYYQENKDEIKAHNAKPEIKSKRSEYNANYYQENKDEKKAYEAKRYQENRDEILAQKAEHNAKPETKAKVNARLTKRRKTDEGYRNEVNLRCRLYQAMKGKKKSASTLSLCGLESGTAIHDYLNLKSPWFKERGVPSEELAKDHIIPCEKYDLTIPDHQKACFHYINMQLLTELDNKRKGDKVPEGFDFESTLKKQLDLIARIEKDKLTYQQVLEMQKAGDLYEVIGYQI